MPFDATVMQIGRKHAYDQRVANSKLLVSTLIPGAGDNNILLGVFENLRTASPPRDVCPDRRKVTQKIDALTIMFYSKNVEDFVKKNGSISEIFALRSARKFSFGQTVAVTRERQGGAIFWCLMNGTSSLSIGERGTARTGFTHRLMRTSGFAHPTGHSAGRRKTGWGPRPESE